MTAPIASATSVEQLREMVAAIDLRLDEESTATLDKASVWRS
jgi:aryl-alcohol dehydrogenase-like predicted oxidoreductase